MSGIPFQAILALAVFLSAYFLIATERLHRTVVALAGGAAVLALGLVPQAEAFGAKGKGIDWNVIFLLLGMMIIVTITRRTGVFQWLAIKSAKAARGEPARLMILLALVTTVLSALLDNVTTVLFMAPITLLIAEGVGISPVPLLITQILASNIGGTATLIGDPPNIMIGSAAGLGFVSFLVNLAPISAVVFIGLVPMLHWMFRHELKAPPDIRERLAGFDETRAISDPRLLRRCLIVLAITFVGFFLHERFHLMPATIALLGAALLLLVSKVDFEEVLHEIEWGTILFFVGLFVMISALEQTGVIHRLAELLLAKATQSPGHTAIGLLWLSAVASALVDNIPFVGTANPMLIELAKGLAGPGMPAAEAVHTPVMMAFWWSLALGACLGGNATLIGASANVVVAGIAEKHGHRIAFGQYLRYGVPVTFMSIVLSTIYVWARYL
jgi:Na+/H+ antiporter NhaD/arsenite permease-like protein